MNDNRPLFLSPADVVARWGSAVTTGTLANWRSRGEGPPFQKFGSRVRYPLAALVEWEAANMQQAPSAAANESKDAKE